MQNFTKDVTVYHNGIYYRRFVGVSYSAFQRRMLSYHTYPSTPGVHYSDRTKLWHNGLGSVGLQSTHSYR